MVVTCRGVANWLPLVILLAADQGRLLYLMVSARGRKPLCTAT